MAASTQIRHEPDAGSLSMHGPGFFNPSHFFGVSLFPDLSLPTPIYPENFSHIPAEYRSRFQSPQSLPFDTQFFDGLPFHLFPFQLTGRFIPLPSSTANDRMSTSASRGGWNMFSRSPFPPQPSSSVPVPAQRTPSTAPDALLPELDKSDPELDMPAREAV